MIQSNIAAKSNPEGAPAGGISALVYDNQQNAHRSQKECDSRTLQQIRTSQNSKNFPYTFRNIRTAVRMSSMR